MNDMNQLVRTWKLFRGKTPLNWIKNDVDLIAIVDSLEGIPKQDCTKIYIKLEKYSKL
jgi:hypothetical protein